MYGVGRINGKPLEGEGVAHREHSPGDGSAGASIGNGGPPAAARGMGSSCRDFDVEDFLQRTADVLMARIPRRAPDPSLLAGCKIISHRGEFDNVSVLENTLPAFDAAARGDVWGIELDVRWTRDGVAVVHHDPDLRRLFRAPERLADLPFDRLRERWPAVPTLQEVVARFGGRLHLMVEIKEDARGGGQVGHHALQPLLSSLRPSVDYHLMALETGLLDGIDFLPPSALLPIARFNVASISRWALRRSCGGVTGHYLMMSSRRIRRHARRGQRVGTGFADSPRCLYREVQRGVEWVFSNRAVALRRLCLPAGRPDPG